MVSAAARSTSAAALVFVASVLLIAPFSPAWCVLIALAAAAWRLLVALGYIAPLKPFADAVETPNMPSRPVVLSAR